MSSIVKPEIIDGVPWCSGVCPSHTGRKCLILSFLPTRLCEPAVKNMAAVLHEFCAMFIDTKKYPDPETVTTGLRIIFPKAMAAIGRKAKRNGHS